MVGSRRRTLWRNNNFLLFWAGESISLFGSQVTTLALPLTAIGVLNAGAGQLGILNALSFAPFLLLTLLAGVWVDRRRRRPLLIMANLGRALLLGLVPVLAFQELLRIEHLYAIGFAGGMLTVAFDVAYQSYLPSLVDRDALTEANSKLTASASIAEIGGPGLGGVLVELLSAPFALALDALSYLVSALGMLLIRAPEPAPAAEHGSILGDIGAGLRLTFSNPYLRAMAGEAATYNLFEQAIWTVLVLYATSELGIGPGAIGIILAVASSGALLGALLAAPLARRFGVGRTILGSMMVACSGPLLIPLASGPRAQIVAMLLAALFLDGFGCAVSNVHVVSLRQTVTPDNMLGRMNASYRTLIYGTIPLGALLGGALGEAIGLRPTLLVSAIGLLPALAWVWWSPVRGLRSMPEQAS